MAETMESAESVLHAARVGELEGELLELARQATGAPSGALFLWDDAERGLRIRDHVVEGLNVTIPDRVIKHPESGQGRPGIALWVYAENTSHLCRDTQADEHYTRYLLDVGSIAAVPIRYQGKPIGVITVSDRATDAFNDGDVNALEELADSSAVFVHRLRLDRQSRERTGRPFLIKGLSPAWLEVEHRIERASPTNAPVLIRGESGTGKDLVANAIHWSSARAQMPLVTVNCAAIPETMLESLLFGHVKGAFTGATFDKLGEFQKADGGSLFLDEVGELPILLQAKVLRAVEQGEVQPLGSNKAPEHVDVRLICATNRDLEAMAGKGTFRGDLFYRLSVMTLELPPLRSYSDNLEVLAVVFVEQAAEKHGKKAPRISPQAMAKIVGYDFPGNVRELKNAMEHALIMCSGDAIAVADLPDAFSVGSERTSEAAVSERSSDRPTLKEQRELWLAPLERRYLVELLDECDGNVREAANRAGINAVTLYRLLRKRGLEIRRGISRK